MQLRSDIQIKSILKAMTDVVLPAIDPANQLAQEQARLCMGLLDLMARQLPLQFRFDLDELNRLAALGEALAQAAGQNSEPSSVSAVQADAAHARDVLGRARAEPSELLTAIKALRASTAALVQQACGHAPGDASSHMEKLVLESSREQLLRDRSWLLPQRWEPDPDAVPAIEALLLPDD